MTQDPHVRFVVYPGPSLAAPYPAVLAEFRPPADPPIPGPLLRRALEALLPPDLAALARSAGEAPTAAALAAGFALGICDRHGPWGFRHAVMEPPGGPSRILLEHLSPAPALEALMGGLEVAFLVVRAAGGQPVAPAPCLERVRQHVARWDALHSDPSTLGQLRVAWQRGIPVYEVASAPRFRLFGQGSSGHLVECTADDRDGYSGCHLAGDKTLSNEVVRRLGYPGVAHHTVQDAEEALAAAQSLGFPVVVKPRTGDMGQGVTAGVTREAELLQAFRFAKDSHPGPVLIERHVEGDTYRLMALNGTFAWALRRRNPQVVGDGLQTVAELVEAENARRAAVPSRPGPRPLRLDPLMQSVLHRQGLTCESRPGPGQVVLLRTTSNWITGGTMEDVTASVHPDNRALAEGIARTFRIATAGIDFITPDIRRSWREGGCAVLEVNPTPGIGSDAQAEALMAARFPGQTQGRIPTVLLVGAPPDAVEALRRALEGSGLRTGFLTSCQTWLGLEPRAAGEAALPDRIRGLLLDPGCQALLVELQPEEALAQGLPLDHIDLAVLGGATSQGDPLAALLSAGVRHTLPWTGPETLAQVMAAIAPPS